MNIKKIVLVIIIILGAWFFVRFVIGGPEDDWICVDNEWIKHGNPSAPKPTTGCGEETIKVKVYFNNNNLDPQISCNKVFPAEREIIKTSAVARAALEELLKGPNNREGAEGFITSINYGVKIQSLIIENGVAKVDFDEQLQNTVGGSCRVSAIRAQITQTLKQFPTVKNVIISINGRTEDILQP